MIPYKCSSALIIKKKKGLEQMHWLCLDLTGIVLMAQC